MTVLEKMAGGAGKVNVRDRRAPQDWWPDNLGDSAYNAATEWSTEETKVPEFSALEPHKTSLE